MANKVDPISHQFVPQGVRARRAAEHDNLKPSQSFNAFARLSKQLQRIGNAVEDLKVMGSHDVEQILFGKRQACVIQMNALAGVDSPEKTAEAVVVIQREGDEPIHVHVDRVVPYRSLMGLVDWLGETGRAAGVDDPCDILRFKFRCEGAGKICIDIFFFVEGIVVGVLSWHLVDLESRVILSQLLGRVPERSMKDKMFGTRIVEQRCVCIDRYAGREEQDGMTEL